MVLERQVKKAVRAQEWERHDYYVKCRRPAGTMERKGQLGQVGWHLPLAGSEFLWELFLN